MPAQAFFGQDIEPHTFDTACRSDKCEINNLLGQTDCFKDLCTLIGAQGRNAHLAHDLQDALRHGFSIVDRELGSAIEVMSIQHIIELRLPQSIESEVWVDRVRAVAEQETVMMHFACLARFYDQADTRAFRLSNEVMVYQSTSEQRRDGNAIWTGCAIRKNCNAEASIDCFLYLTRNALEGNLSPAVPSFLGHVISTTFDRQPRWSMYLSDDISSLVRIG